MSIVTCPKCQSQLEVKLAFASGPKKSTQSVGIGELLDAAEAREDLTEWESQFVTDLRPRYDRYGEEGTRMSDKQMEILRKIASGKK